MADITGTSQEECLHCLCKQDTAGVWYCCKCGFHPKPWSITSTVYYPSLVIVWDAAAAASGKKGDLC